MERLTKPNGRGEYYFSECWKKCEGEPQDCENCPEDYKICQKLGEYEDAEENGLMVRLPCKVGDTVYELCECVDGIYRIFPMTVVKILPYGSVRWIKGEEPTVWNIYATHDYTKMYKNFYDFGKTVFLTREEAEKAFFEGEGK